jgi:hypothetical protein
MGFLTDEVFILVDEAHAYHHTSEDVKGFEGEQSLPQTQDPEVQS